jgi:glycosyltransferase involved in cell wall biosynthesis
MACGAPVIASTAGALPEVVGDAALVVDPRSVTAIRSAMDELVHSPWLGKDLSERGPVRAQRFSWQEAAIQVEAVLHSVL